MNDANKIVEGNIVEINNGEKGVQAYIKVKTKNNEMVLVTIRPGGRFQITNLEKKEVF